MDTDSISKAREDLLEEAVACFSSDQAVAARGRGTGPSRGDVTVGVVVALLRPVSRLSSCAASPARRSRGGWAVGVSVGLLSDGSPSASPSQPDPWWLHRRPW